MHAQQAPSQLSPVMQVLHDHIESHFHGGERWPDDAEFAVVYRTSTWPIGWHHSNYTEFFTSRKALAEWMEKKEKWSSMEDNLIAWRIYEWDLGPQRLFELDHNSGNV